MDQLNLEDIIKNDIAKHISLLSTYYEYKSALNAIVDFEIDKLKYVFKTELCITKLKALDALNREFTVNTEDYDYLYRYINELMQLRINNQNIPLQNLLLISNIRFSVLYKENEARIIDMPTDIYKFLMKNNYNKEVFAMLLSGKTTVIFRYFDATKLILKVGKSFKEKSELLGIENSNNKNNLLQYVRSKLYPEDYSLIRKSFRDKVGNSNYDKIAAECKTQDISLSEIICRVEMKDLKVEEAFKLGIVERDKYGITYTDNDYKEIFYKIVREYIKEKDNSE